MTAAASGTSLPMIVFCALLCAVAFFLAFFKFDKFIRIFDFVLQKVRAAFAAMKRRITRMTQSGADTTAAPEASRFTGSVWGWFGVRIVFMLGMMFSFGVAFPWLVCYRERYIASRTRINGRRIYFDGTGVQLIGKYIQWLLLSIITLGIYSLWLRLKIKKWVLSHTHFEGVEKGKSDFDGGLFALTGISIASNYLSLVTLGIASYWMHCWKERYITGHSVIDGHRLYFDGTGTQYFAKKIVWVLLTVVTFGVYSFWLAHRSKQWTVKHTWTQNPETIPLDFEKECQLVSKETELAEEKLAKKKEKREKALENRKHPLFRQAVLWLIPATPEILMSFMPDAGGFGFVPLIFATIAMKKAKEIQAFSLFMVSNTYFALAIIGIVYVFATNMFFFGEFLIGFKLIFFIFALVFLIIYLLVARKFFAKKQDKE